MYVKDVKDGERTHTHTLWLITFLIFNRFLIRKSFEKLSLRAFQPYHQILCILKHVEDVKDRSNTCKGCNAMYVEDGKRTYADIFLKKFLLDTCPFLGPLIPLF